MYAGPDNFWTSQAGCLSGTDTSLCSVNEILASKMMTFSKGLKIVHPALDIGQEEALFF